MPDEGKHRLTPDEYRSEEGVAQGDPAESLVTSYQETLAKLDELASTLPDYPIPERMDQALSDIGVVTDKDIARSEDSVKEKLYVEWGKRYNHRVGEIRTYILQYPHDPLSLISMNRVKTVSDNISRISIAIRNSPSAMAMEINAVIKGYDELADILQGLKDRFGDDTQVEG